MDPRREPRLSQPPATRPAAPPAVPAPPPTAPDSPPPQPRPRFDWRRITRSPRGAACVATIAAALLLWPFAGFSWIPWLAGVTAVVVLRLLRLDGPLRGWDLPLAGLVVVIGLMLSTGPWAWALAGSIGVLLAGLAQLPWWRLAAVGAVLCVISGIGFGFSVHQERVEREQVQARAGDSMRVQLGEGRPARILPAVIHGVHEDDAGPICRLLSPQAEGELLTVLRAPTCEDAVGELHRRVVGEPLVDEKALPQPQASPDGWTIDACSTTWARAAGPELGRLLVFQTDPGVQRFAVRAFAPC